jgi:hypothetical protein
MGKLARRENRNMGKLARRENRNIGRGSFRQRDSKCIVLVQCGKTCYMHGHQLYIDLAIQAWI